MPVIKQKSIYRDDLRSHPAALYLFGDNDYRIGLGGQAREMRGEPNALGVRTKRAPGMRPADFWSDVFYRENCDKIDADLSMAFQAVQTGGTVVIPLDGLGTGLSRLSEVAPRTAAYLNARLAALAAPDQDRTP